MKKIIGVLLLFVISVNFSIAQSTIGFSDPEDIQSILEYRLPDWGYSNFLLNFSLNGRFDDSKISRTDLSTDSQDRDFHFIIDPGYRIYRESEQRIISLNSDALLLYRNNRRETESPTDQLAQNRKSIDTEISIYASLREYISPRWFFLVNEDASFEYRYGYSEDKSSGLSESLQKTFDRRFISNSRVGIGLGRVRNVNPVIRAVRMNERYQAVTEGSQLSQEELEAVANMFTKYQGYESRYDRPEKYFWESMDQAVNSSISDLNAFDLLYLTDVLDENFGNRLQGWDASIGGIFYYSNSLQREENNMGMNTNRDFDIQKSGGFFGEVRWFKNLSLKHQISFNVDSERIYSIDSDSFLKWNMNIFARVSWLWNLTDRFLLSSQLNNRYNAIKFEEDFFNSDHRRWSNSTVLGSSLIYFIENRLAINAGLNFLLRYNGDTNSSFSFDRRIFSTRLNAGIRYYFSRNLY